jgi:hypothetical protein
MSRVALPIQITFKQGTQANTYHVRGNPHETPHCVPLQQKVAAVSVTPHPERFTRIVTMDLH